MTITNDELPNNHTQNGIGPGPGPPDDCTTTHVNVTTSNSTNTHSDLTGKSSNLSNSHDTATTTTSCSMCPSGSCLNFSSTDETDHDFDLSSVSPVCHCDFDCGEHFASSSLTATSPTTAPNDNNCTLSSSNSVMNLRTMSSSTNFLQHALPRHRHYISSPFKETMSSPSTCNISSIITSANSCATGPVTSTNSSYLCSTSAPTGATGLNTRSILNKITSTHNNNTCSINNNSTSTTTTTTLCSLANKTPPPPPHHNSGSSSRGLAGFFCSNNIRSTSKTDVSECHHPQQQLQQQQQPNLQQKLQKQQYQRHHNHHCHHDHHHHNNQNHPQEHFDNNQHKQLKSSDSLSDVSDTFEWWFQRHKRNSAKKSRYILQIPQPCAYILTTYIPHHSHSYFHSFHMSHVLLI